MSPSPPGAVCLFLTREDGRILAISRRHDETKYGLLGGKIDPGETAEEALIREVKQEGGLVVANPKRVLTRLCRGKVDYLTVAFEAEVVSDPLRLSALDPDAMDVGPEGTYLRWVSPQVLLEGPFGDFNKALFRRVLLNEAIGLAAYSLEPDEDDLACADDFPIPTREVCAKAIELAKRILDFEGAGPDHVPRFGMAGDGGVALHWRNRLSAELFLTIKPEGNPLHFDARAGEATLRGSQTVEGPVEHISAWLINHMWEDETDATKEA